MTPLISMHLARAIASSSTAHRPGARHAMLIFVHVDKSEELESLAIAAAQSRGWIEVELRKSKILDSDLELIGDDTLRSAAESSLVNGSSVVVYADELPLDR